MTGTNDRGKFFEVMALTELRGSAPFDVAFRVSDRSGRNLFFDIIIEGISLLSSERVEIGALLVLGLPGIPEVEARRKDEADLEVEVGAVLRDGADAGGSATH